MNREALNMALQALETLMIERGSIYDKAITAIKEALEQQEPNYKKALEVWLDKTEWVQKTVKPHELGMHRADVLKQRIEEALAQPEQHQDWCASLTQMLMSMPPKPAPCNCKPKPEQEPVACVTYKEVADTMNGLWGGTLVQRQIAEELENTMLYTTPPQSKPLTDEEIILIVAECAASHQHTDIHFARAIERAHGIKELV